jgi:tripartite-type tricarboxylate transporter receptor subunit TctC
VKQKTFWILVLGLVVWVSFGSSPGNAQSWPQRAVMIIVPFAAGGGTDAFMRPLAAQLDQQMGTRFLIENRAGGGGTIGAAAETLHRSGHAARATRSPRQQG